MRKFLSSSALRSTRRAGLPSRNSTRARLDEIELFLRFLVAAAQALLRVRAPASRGYSRSASINSVSIVSMSRIGSMPPST